MKNNFGTWLQQEREKNNLSQSALANLAKLNRAVISKIENNASKPTPETLSAIAHALKLPPEFVFRKAGLLPAKNPVDEDTERIAYKFSKLSPRDKKHFENFLDNYLKDDKEQETKKSQKNLARTV